MRHPRYRPAARQRGVPISAFLGVAFGVQNRAVHHDGAADQVGIAASLLVLVQEVDRVTAAKAEIDRVHVVRKRGNDRAKVLRSERNPETFGDLTTRLAVFQRKTEDLRVDEGIVLADRRDGFPGLFR